MGGILPPFCARLAAQIVAVHPAAVAGKASELGTWVKLLARHESYDADVDPSGELLATISTRGISIWSLPGWKSEAHIECGTARCVTFTEHATGVTVWDIKSKTSMPCAEKYRVGGAVFEPTDRFLLVDTYEALLMLEAQSLSIVESIPWKTSNEAVRWPSVWAFANDGKLLAIRRVPYVINLVDLSSDSVLADIPVNHPYPWIQLTPNGDRLICTDEKMRTQILELGDIRKELKKFGLDWELNENNRLDR